MSKNIITFAIIGAGSRGLKTYGKYILQNHSEAKVVAVAEPRAYLRNEAMKDHKIISENVFKSWEDLLNRPRLADAIIIATTDRLHIGPTLKAIEKGYHILLEKPMAPTASECTEIINAVQKKDVIFAVCHVLRYAPFFKAIKDILESGKIGDICSIQHMEGVGWWHFPHSFVRGNFGNVEKSSFMLLAKCCHDIDLLRWWVGKPCINVSSFGYLKHFRKENQPKNAGDKCIDCALADANCPYSAKKFYFERLHHGLHHWPLDMLVNEMTEEALYKALKDGPYGRCAYLCDNDVVDTQIVNMDFENSVLVSMIVSAFTPIGRRVRVMGTKGYLEGDEETIRMLDFVSGKWSEIQANTLAVDITGGHGGGDAYLMNAFLNAIRNNERHLISSGPEVSLESHLIVFAAERARNEKKVINIKTFLNEINKDLDGFAS